MSAARTVNPSVEMQRRRRLQATADDPLLTRPEVEAETGLGRSAIYDRIKKGAFPRPLKLSRRAVRWRASDIAAWKNRQPLSAPA